MVAIAPGLQARITDVALAELGPEAGAFLQEVCRNKIGVEFEQIDFQRIEALIVAAEQDARSMLGHQIAAALADDIVQLHADVEAGLSGRMVRSTARVLGLSAEVFLQGICRKLGVTLDAVDRAILPLIAEEAFESARALLGQETATEIRTAIERAASVRPAGMVAAIVDAATRNAGQQGERLIREFCRTVLETELDELEPDALPLLAGRIRADAGPLLGQERSAAFALAVRAALVSPNEELRARIIALVRPLLGPASEDFLVRTCRKAGMPWTAMDTEHIEWLAGVVQAEAGPLLGKRASELAGAILKMRPDAA